MSLIESSLSEFAGLLAAKTSVPGGGGASAAVGALAAALGSMVGQFTLGKKRYADVEEDISRLMEEAESLRIRLLECIDRDAVAFEPLSKAYGLPKDAPGRDETLELCLKDAAGVPAEIAELSAQVIDMQAEFAAKGSTLMISDAGVGVIFARAALQGAILNVKVNTRLMKDREYAAKLDARMDELAGTYIPRADEVYDRVLGKLS